MNNDGKIGSEYTPDYIDRQDYVCPHCKEMSAERTNRYLFRCTNFEACGRYW